MLATEAVLKVRHVSRRHPGNAEGFRIGLREPRGEFPQILDHGAAGVGREVLFGKVALDQGGFPRPDRDGEKNIITRILHGLSPRIGHKLDTETL